MWVVGFRVLHSACCKRQYQQLPRETRAILQRSVLKHLGVLGEQESSSLYGIGWKHLRLKNQYKHTLVHSVLPTVDAPVKNRLWGEKGSTTFGSVDRFEEMCEAGHVDRALDAVCRLDHQGIVVPVSLYRSLLKACSKRKALAEAKRVHHQLAKHRLESTFLGEDLVRTFVKCGGLEDALYLFHRLPEQTVSSWTALISGYTTFGQYKEALRMYEMMQEKGVEPNAYTFVSLLKACGNIADLELGHHIHAEVVKFRCESDSFVRTCLVDMYRKCGSILYARKVFDTMFQRDVVTCNAMLTAYAQQGQAEKALQLFENMRKEGIDPNARTYVSVLQACGMLADKGEGVVMDCRSTKQRYLEYGRAIHAEAKVAGYDSDVFVGNTLVSMYGKCGSIVDAQNVFDRLAERNVVSWNAMLAVYIQHSKADLVLKLYDRMHEQHISPDARTFVSAFQACGMVAENDVVNGQVLWQNILEKGRAIHSDARQKGYDSDVFVGNTLISMYWKCGSIVDAQKVFDSLSRRDLVSWNAILGAYTQQGQPEKSLQLYQQMLEKGISPDVRTLVNAVQACGMIAEDRGSFWNDGSGCQMFLEQGRQLHEDACSKGYDTNVFFGSTLISMYWKCGSIIDAQEVFDGLSHRNVVSWNAMLAGYLQHGEAEKALELYVQMQEAGVSPDDCTLMNALQCCAVLAEKELDIVVDGQSTKAKSWNKGKAVHADAWRKGCHSDVFVGSILVSMYAKCGSIMDAESVFNGLLQRNVVSWNAMLTAYAQQGLSEYALQLYEQMQKEGVHPDIRTFVSTLQACSSLAEKDQSVVVEGHSLKVKGLAIAKAIQVEAWRKSYAADVFIGNTLISMYGKCGSTLDAQNIFDELQHRDVVSWNAMVVAYVKQSHAEKCLELYEQMQAEGVSPDLWTFVGLLQACGLLADKEEPIVMDGRSIKGKALERGKALHADSWRRGCHGDTFVANTLLSMYGKCGSIVDAQNVFDGLSEQSLVSWNSLLAGYSQEEEAEKALQLYRRMQEVGVSPDEITFMCMLQSCSNAGSLDVLRQIHHTLVSTGNNLIGLLANTLIHAYGKCASMVDAQKVFAELPQPDVVSWNALIAGFARQGNCATILQLCEEMQVAGIKPNGITFLLLLGVCSHAGLVDKGVEYFESMSRHHGIAPQIEHYASMVDLLGRAGYFTQVEDLLSTMPMEPDLAVWLCLLGACRNHGKIALGERAFRYAVHLEPKHAAAYVLMSNIYADAGLWDCARGVKALKSKEGAGKKPGQSWIEHDQEVHPFTVGDLKHPLEEQLYDLVGLVSSELDKEAYVAQTSLFPLS